MIKFREINLSSIKDFKYIAKWDNSADAYLFRPNFRESSGLDPISASYIFSFHNPQKKISYMIEYEDEIVGKVGYTISFAQLHNSDKNTAWLDIVIGEKSARGKGIGSKAIDFIENKVREAGLKKIELGVFEFNKKAYSLYLKKGYKEIALLDNVTYYKGKWHRDIRMEKEL